MLFGFIVNQNFEFYRERVSTTIIPTGNQKMTSSWEG